MDRFGDLQFLGRLDNRGYVVERDPGLFVPGIGRLKANLFHPVLLKWASDLPCSLQNFDVVVEVRNGAAHCNRIAARHLKVYTPLFENDSGLLPPRKTLFAWLSRETPTSTTLSKDPVLFARSRTETPESSPSWTRFDFGASLFTATQK